MSKEEIKEDLKEKRSAFIERWKEKGKERQDTHSFWIELLTDVLGIQDATKRINFEKTVEIDGHTKFIDAYIPETKVLIEQKDSHKSLMKEYPMSGTDKKYTPYEQGDRYGRHMNHDEHPRFIVACNFNTFEVHDNNHRGSPPQIIKLEDLEQDYTRLFFLVNSDNVHLEREKELSVQAGRLVGKIYDALLEKYHHPEDEETLKSLNILIVRLVFILYAEDAGIFKKQQFLDYIEPYRDNPAAFRRALIDLFDVLDTPIEDRDPYLEEELLSFPYVNGGLFNRKLKVEIPTFNKEIIDLILDDASIGFNWEGISPTIFGATFESTINPETRRSGGMHYTSIQNIHKVIDPLFLDDLKAELDRIKKNTNRGSQANSLIRFRDKLASLKFLDPACGSGNFLTETYLELRRLENEALSIYLRGQMMFADETISPIKVNLDQFYGIEINDFAVSVANTALFISEYQMLKETEAIIRQHIDYLPLQSFDGIHEGNALRMDWNDVLPASECNYIMGNPPFVGHQWRNKEQVEDMKLAFPDLKKHGKLDYVCAWYNKSADYMKNTNIEASFVSTNSIVQGESVVILWTFLMEKGIKINFAHQTFIWTNETKNSASVYCVIIGFSMRKERKNKRIYTETSSKLVENINGYLLDGPQIFLKARKQPISPDVPIMHRGSDPVDGGFLLMSLEDKENYIKAEPDGIPYIRPYMMGREFLNKIERFCFWLEDVPPHLLKKLPILLERIEKVKNYRLQSSSKSTVRAADTPSLFYRRVQPKNAFLAIPKVSSEKRRYIPIDFLNSDIIAGDMLFITENPTLYHFGILTSNVHNAWMRTVAGRLEMRYRYSKDIVYNNFPWPEPTDIQKKKIEQTAQAILDVRAKYPDASLADLYDELTMPEDLRKAHRANDRAVMEAYGWNWRTMTEEECVAELMKIYADRTK